MRYCILKSTLQLFINYTKIWTLKKKKGHTPKSPKRWKSTFVNDYFFDILFGFLFHNWSVRTYMLSRSLSVNMEGWQKMFMIIFAISRYVFCDFICYDVICNTIWWKEKKLGRFGCAPVLLSGIIDIGHLFRLYSYKSLSFFYYYYTSFSRNKTD